MKHLLTQHLVKSSLCILLLHVFTSSYVHGQTWSLYGNSISGYERLGTRNATPLNLSTYGQIRMSITSQGQVGIGTAYPNARQEINYCPPSGQKENGLVVSLFNCKSGSYGYTDPNGGGLEGPGDGGGATSGLPISFLTGNSTTGAQPLFDANHAPLLWLREQTPPTYYNYLSGYTYDTKMIVTPQGNCGINVTKPRAALDVRGSQLVNMPTAIFGTRVASTSQRDPNTGLTQYYTRQLQIVPLLQADKYNRIVQTGDQGIFFSDGLGADGANQASALVLAPWAAGSNPDIGGMRMDAQGNTEFHGTVRTTEMVVNAQWWSDFVFGDNYKLPSLAEVEAYITENKHLPNVPSEAEVLEKGINVADMQAIHQQKIEELTLYIIQLKKEMVEMKRELAQIKKQ